MINNTKLYPLLKDIGLDDKKSQEFIEIIEATYHSKIEQETNRLLTNETFVSEMASMKAEFIKWNVGTIIAVAGVVAAIAKLIG
jgi:hypothetical protein